MAADCDTGAVDDLMVERVLRAAECVPPGRVTTYGQIADLVGTGARQVGRVMATAGAAVPWWRVVNAQGRLPAHLSSRALAEWRREGVACDEGLPAVQLSEARVRPEVLSEAYSKACADLPDHL